MIYSQTTTVFGMVINQLQFVTYNDSSGYGRGKHKQFTTFYDRSKYRYQSFHLELNYE